MKFLTSDAERVCLFPGQVVRAVGRGEKDRFHATEIQAGVPLPAPQRASSFSAKDTAKENLDAVRAVHALAACGPFCRRNDADYGTLKSLLEYALDARPELVVLTGPFVDAQNAAVREGGMEAEPGLFAAGGSLQGQSQSQNQKKPLVELDLVDLQEKVVIPLLENFVRQLKESVEGAEVLIVPSPDEAMFVLPTPSPPYPDAFLSHDWLRLEDVGAKLCANPCFVRINGGIVLSATSQDPLMPLIKGRIESIFGFFSCRPRCRARCRRGGEHDAAVAVSTMPPLSSWC